MDKKLTLEEKIAYCSGLNFWNTKAIKGIPSFMMSDGPHGLRKQVSDADMLGINRSIAATSFPTASLSACSFDPELLGQMSQAIGLEAKANGVSLLLGPGANIKRNPLCGRNFEYFSEDPYLSGKLAAGYIKGAESIGVMTSLKHFALNNQEYKRFSSDSIVDERTMREIYLRGFEIAVKEGKPSTIMCSYNKINGIHSSDNHWLLTDVLRNEWGFDGMVVTDWGAMSNRIAGFKAGCDLNMPGGSTYMEKEALEAVKAGNLSEEDIDRSVERIQKCALKAEQEKKNIPDVDMEAHYQLARKVATESAVLLKNEGLLPLENTEDLIFVGPMAENLRYQGAGSSHINPWKLKNILEVCPAVPFFKGCKENGDADKTLLKEAKEAARTAKKVIIFAGLTDSYESEGFDRENMEMPKGHNQLIEELAKVNENVAVVLFSGSAVEVPWADQVKTILYMGLPGEAGAEAVMDLLLGKVNPSGKLAESWPYRYSDCINSSYYGKKDAHYREGVYVGYRYYSSAHIPVRYPFGYGLSCTSFAYSDLKVEDNKVICTITNTGSVLGKETVQLYITPPEGKFYRPVKELKGFKKIELNPTESKEVTFTLDDNSFALWNKGWIVPQGTYTVSVGSSSENLLLSATLEKEETETESPEVPEWYFSLKGIPTNADFEKLVGHSVSEPVLKKGEFTMENSVVEMKDYSLIMKMMYKIMELVLARSFGGKPDYSNPSFRMMMASAADCSLSGMRINSGLKRRVFEGMLEMANGHFLKGVITMVKK